MTIDDTIQYLESRLGDNPKSLVFAHLADLYLTVNRIDDAIELCIEGLKHHPTYNTANFILGKAYLAKNDSENAEAELKKVLSHDRQYLAAHKLLGDLMAKMGWENKAALHYKDILRIDPLEEKTKELIDLYPFEESPPPPPSPRFERPPEPNFPQEKPHPAEMQREHWENRLEELFPEKDSKDDTSEASVAEVQDETEPTIPQKEDLEFPDEDPSLPEKEDETTELSNSNHLDEILIPNTEDQNPDTEIKTDSGETEEDALNPLFDINDTEDDFSSDLSMDEEPETPGKIETQDQEETVLQEDEPLFELPDDEIIEKTGDGEDTKSVLDADEIEFPLDFLNDTTEDKSEETEADSSDYPFSSELPPIEDLDQIFEDPDEERHLEEALQRQIESEPSQTKDPIQQESDTEETEEIVFNPHLLDTAIQAGVDSESSTEKQSEPETERVEAPSLSTSQESEDEGVESEKPSHEQKDTAKNTPPVKPASGSKGNDKIVSPTLGEIYAAQGQYNKAIKVYENLIEKKPEYEEKYREKIEELKQKRKDSLSS